MSNLIQSHEAAILAEVGSKKLEDMQDRLIQFKNNQSKEKSDTGQYYECIRQYRDLEREADIALTGIEANLSRVFKSENKKEITNTIIVAFKKSKSDAVVRMNEALKISKMNMLQFTNRNMPNKHQSRTLSKHALTQNSLKHLLAHEKLKSLFTAEGEEPEYKCLAQLIKHREDLMTQGLILEEEYNKANEDITAANEKIIYHFRLNSLSIYSEDVIPSSIEKKLTDVEDQLAHHFKINFRVIYSAEINLLIRDLKTELSNVRFNYKQKLFHPRHHNDKNKISLINNTNRNTVKAYKQWIKRGDCREKILALHHLKTKTKNSRKVEKQWQYLDKERLKRQKDKAALEDTERTMKKVTQKTEEKIEALRQTIIKQVILDIKDPICDALDREHEIRLELLKKVQTEARRVESKKESLLMSKTREANRIKTALTEERKCKAKIKIKNHLRLKEKKLNHIKILKKHQQYEDEMKRLERVKTNKLRVGFRHKKTQSKIRHDEEVLEQGVQDEAKKLERLTALASTVPYYSNITNKKANLLKSTVSRDHDIYEEECSGLADFQLGLKKINSFTEKKIFSDHKFRLGNALHEAGLAKTKYAQAIVKRLIPRKVERTTGIG